MKSIVKYIIIIICTIVLLVFINGCYFVFCGQFKAAEKIKQGKELSLYECCSAYTMHMAIWMFGWVIAPEAAYEAMLMHVPHEDNQVCSNDCFWTSSKKIEPLLYGDSDEPFSWKSITWSGQDYVGGKEQRYALALNSNCMLMYDGIQAILKADIVYGNHTWNICGIPITTHAFHYLQKIGWLHPYTIWYSHEVEPMNWYYWG